MRLARPIRRESKRHSACTKRLVSRYKRTCRYLHTYKSPFDIVCFCACEIACICVCVCVYWITIVVQLAAMRFSRAAIIIAIRLLVLARPRHPFHAIKYRSNWQQTATSSAHRFTFSLFPVEPKLNSYATKRKATKANTRFLLRRD